MARGVDCSWIQLVSHALSLSFKRKNIQRATQRERERESVEKHIALQELQSLCAHRKKGKRSSPFSIKNGFLILPFSCVSPLKLPVRTCRCYLQRGRCRAPSLSPFLSQITTHACGGHAGRPSCQGNAFLTFDHDVRAAVSSERKYK